MQTKPQHLASKLTKQPVTTKQTKDFKAPTALDIKQFKYVGGGAMPRQYW
jgi:hypothetical protein